MRAGGYTVQQALTPEAANMVKQAVALARRRGHAQVTPLHVANTMLAASTGLLRTACLQSHSHPLQCKALELCFNVALNRLPTSTASSMLGSHGSLYPSISNALVAAFKRAQAHQRRGSIENQQQPILAVKIEIEQLIISILDDPSVSRVMKEAGFSSTQVKSNVEQAVSLEICSKTTSGKPKESGNALPLSQAFQFQTSKLTPVRSEDVMYVIDNLVNKRRNFVVVGECVDTIVGVIRAVVNKVDRRDVPEALRDVKFVTLSFSSVGQLSRAEVEQKLEKLKALVRSCLGKGVILNLGDLNWVVEYRARSSGDRLGRGYNYCAVEHMVMELGKLACGLLGESGRFWLMGIATFQTYMRCKSGHPSLESVWCLNILTIPAGSLRLSLITDSELESDEATNKKVENGPTRLLLLEGGDEEKQQLTCCADCSAKFETEARSLQSSSSSASNLPAWLRQYKNENKGLCSSNDKDSASIKDLCKKWNLMCNSIHKQPYTSSSEKTLTFPSFSPSSSISAFSYELQRPNLHQTSHDWPVEPGHHHFLMSETSNISREPNLRLFIREHDEDLKMSFSSNPNSTRNSPSSSDLMEIEYSPEFKELNAENLTTLCDALEKNVPWQKNIIPEIARTVLKCRSGMTTRKGNKVRENESKKEETWLFFQGVDVEAKEKVARELARLVFGTQKSFVSICLSSFSSTRADSTEDIRNKRSRDEQSWSYIERFSEAISSNPHRVFFVEDIEQADYFSQMGFKRATERGRVNNVAGEEISLSDAIIILSCESFSSRSRACSPPIKQKSSDGSDKEEKHAVSEHTSPCVSLDLNLSIDDEISDDQSIDDMGLLEAIDARITFKTQRDL